MTLYDQQKEKRDNAIKQVMENAIGSGNIELFYKLVSYMVDNHILPSTEDSHKWTYIKGENEIDDFDRRIKTKLGKIFRKQFSAADISDHILNAFVSALNVQLWPSCDSITVGNGEFIQRAYNEIYLGSCMHKKDMSLLVNNPDIVSLARLDDRARALIWTIDGNKYMDRIYPNDCNDIAHRALVNYAEKKGMIVRDHHALPFGDVTFNGELLEIELDCNGVEFFPYMDSFHYVMYLDSYDIRLSTDSDKDDQGLMDNTDGEISGSIICSWCSDRTNENNSRYIECEGDYVCDNCIDNNFIYCEVCEEYARSDDSSYIESEERCVCDRCYSGHYNMCESCGNNHRTEDMTLNNSDNCLYCDNCAEKHLTICDDCCCHFDHDCTTVHGDQVLCESCLDEKKNCED